MPDHFYGSLKWCKECRKADERRRRRDPTLRAKYQARYETDIPTRAAVIFSRIKKRAKADGLRFDLTVEWVAERLGRGVCEVSGVPFDLRVDHPYGPSVDRVLPGAKGGDYTQVNCRLVLNLVNAALQEWGEEPFYAVALAVSAKLRLGS